MMLGDYLKYNARPTDWKAAPEAPKKAEPEVQESKRRIVPEFASTLEAEEGYNPYDHPIDRRFLEKR